MSKRIFRPVKSSTTLPLSRRTDGGVRGAISVMSRLKFRERRNVGGGGGKRSSESRFARMGRGGRMN